MAAHNEVHYARDWALHLKALYDDFSETGRIFPAFDPFSEEVDASVTPTSDILMAFRKYRTMGTRPFYAEGNFEDRFLAVLDKTLYADIPFFLPNVTDGNLRLMKAIIATLAASPIPRLKVNSLCADWGIGANKLYQILEVMESVEVLRIIRAEHDTKAKSLEAHFQDRSRRLR